MSRQPEMPRLVVFSDSDMSTDSDDPMAPEMGIVASVAEQSVENTAVEQISQSGSREEGMSHRDEEKSDGNSGGASRYGQSRWAERKSRSPRGRSASRSSSRSRSRSGSRSRRRSGSRSRRRSSSRSRRRSGSGGRRRRRSRSSSRHRESGRRRRRSSSGGRHRNNGAPRWKDRRHPSPRRRSPPRAIKTLDTLEKLGIELKPQPPQLASNPSGALPQYYRPGADPDKYARQAAKRKLLWGAKTGESSSGAGAWMGATFSEDRDGKVSAKFKRLMGIKAEGEGGTDKAEDLTKRQQELFSRMELQYEAARQATHTQRGVGLGFSSHTTHQPPPPPPPSSTS